MPITIGAMITKVKQIPMKRILVLLIAALTLNVFGATTDDKTKGESTTSLPVKSITINGKVTDKHTGEALAGVAVKTDGSTTCYSDFDGNFSIQVNPEKLENLSAELISYSTSVVGSLALIGFPFLAGFYSKDTILEVSASTFTVAGQFSYVLGLLAPFCTAFYSTRLIYLVFLASPNGNKNIILKAFVL